MKRALISVSDKANLVPFAKGLAACGYEIISTGGTFKLLQAENLPVIQIQEVTDFPEMLDGRVKTLHPKIHGGLLALRDNETHMSTCREHNINLIDLVVVNLYPFEATIAKENVSVEEAIENIDIGGPSMLRSASKNYRSVGVVVNPNHYDSVLKELKENNAELSQETKAKLAFEAFSHTAHYDSTISRYFQENVIKSDKKFPDRLSPVLEKMIELRYGENPHQSAAFYKVDSIGGLTKLKQKHGKELSYNNIADLESAAQIVSDFEAPAVAIIKHSNPCGAAVAETISDAYKKAHEADPVSAFGSIIGLNREVDLETAEEISKTFVEVVVAPSFNQKAFDLLSKKPSLRLIELDTIGTQSSEVTYKYVDGGFLVQTADTKKVEPKDWNIVTSLKPNSAEEADLKFAFTLVKHVKSNAILIAKDGVAIGVGAGQMSRIEAVEIAIKKAGDKTNGAVLASDAFFPFKDSVEIAAKSDIKAIIQPGGSKRDDESIESCNSNNISMAFTGVRHFKH
ncbi:bifunctional phosphoribosylaminoimidazolecarboxamide formyltransferase/inosine monophosphate cyclohydrolase [Candidatus Marinamargulisbacteria bacterium SCGC AAA071-K20]|nr:bifunctional phosphoribosylaminoimidazolecarboxamide formyltransferase/inosine monophosphate cyclohydrolase [Candidatus Marinamargulisbacteria bacterium SCGC AAA071-K20]